MTTAPNTQQLVHRQRRLMKARNSAKRRLADQLHAQLTEAINDHFDHLFQVLQSGGLLRVAIETAYPAGEAPPEIPPEPPVERTTPTGNQIILLND